MWRKFLGQRVGIDLDELYRPLRKLENNFWQDRQMMKAGNFTGITGFPIHLAADLIEATQNTQAFVLYSSCMKSLAIKLSKVCNDLRLLSSGPRCGLREIRYVLTAGGIIALHVGVV